MSMRLNLRHIFCLSALRRWARVLLLAMVSLACIAGAPLFAQSPPSRQILDLDQDRQPIGLADWGDYWVDATGVRRVEQLAGVPESLWLPTRPGETFHLKPGEVLWIRLAAPAADDTQRWFLALPNPGLDRVTLYTRESNDAWSHQVAGDRVAQASWPVPHRYPVFPLVISAAQPSYYALRIESSGSFSAPIMFENERGLSLSQQRVSMGMGVYFGLLVAAAMLMAAYSFLDRSIALLFFGLWSVMLLLAIASALGVAGMYLWPDAPEWNDMAEQVLPTLSFAPLLLFVATATSINYRSPRLFSTLCALAVCVLATAAALAWIPPYWRYPVASCVGVVAGVAAAWPLIWVGRHGEQFGLWLLAALAPLALSPLVPLARTINLIPYQEWVAYVVPAAAAMSVSLVFLLLTQRAQEQRDRKRRLTQLDQIDPSTGLVNDAVFTRRAGQTIVRSQRMGHASLAVLVEISNLPKLRSTHSRRQVQALIVNMGARLGSFVRSTDTAARVGDARFALIFEGPVPVERSKLSSMATKILTQCINAQGGLPYTLQGQVRLALVLIPHQARTAEALMMQLDELLLGADAEDKRSIFFADLITPAEAANSGPLRSASA
jgi:GGDEF domain-containing protein